MQVRLAQPDDAAAIASVDVRSWRAAYLNLMPAAYLATLAESQKTTGWRLALERDEARGKRTLVVEATGSVAGFAVVGPDEQAGPGLLWLMYVDPVYWGRGAARPLMRGSLEQLCALEYTEARLWVLEGNTRARRFYARCGWAEDGATGTATHGGVELPTLRYALALK